MSTQCGLDIYSRQASESSLHASTQFSKYNIQYASIALVYYDYFLTFSLEVNLIWRSKFRFSTILYILTRYAMVANILYLLAISSKLSNCDVWYRVIGVLSTLGRASVIIVFCGRTYAIWNRSRFVLVGLGILGLTCVILDCLHIPGLKCQGSTGSQIQDTLLSILVCTIELVVAILTVYNALISSRVAAFKQRDLTGFILRQGVLYFCGAFVFTASAMVLNFVAKPGSFMIKVLNAFTLPFSCLLTSRFLLHLREYNVDERGDSDSSKLTTLNFVEEFARSTPDSPLPEVEDDIEVDVEEGGTGVWSREHCPQNGFASTSRISIGPEDNYNQGRSFV